MKNIKVFLKVSDETLVNILTSLGAEGIKTTVERYFYMTQDEVYLTVFDCPPHHEKALAELNQMDMVKDYLG